MPRLAGRPIEIFSRTERARLVARAIRTILLSGDPRVRAVITGAVGGDEITMLADGCEDIERAVLAEDNETLNRRPRPRMETKIDPVVDFDTIRVAPCCDGCNTTTYRLTLHDGAIEHADYCGSCAELAHMDWPGNIAHVEPLIGPMIATAAAES